ncbi:MAG: methylmalonyl Co-A mutase-associated GTPase MeaB [Magnetovibrionaceae bacterium]
MKSPEQILEGLMAGERPAIARMISLAEEGAKSSRSVLAEVFRKTGKAHVVGLTGVPGAGKSTMVRALAEELRRRDKRVGIIAIDPSSPFSGGAILGDRVRMASLSGDEGVFIRSMATRGALGGLARGCLDAVDVLDAAGFDIVLIETVGVGQDEVDIVQAAETVVVVSAPGLGDEVQAIKAGVLEIADIHVVSKCDKPDAPRTVSDLKAMMTLAPAERSLPGWAVPVLPTSSEKGTGIDGLVDALEAHQAFLNNSGEGEARRRRILAMRILKTAEDLIRDRFLHADQSSLEALVDRTLSGALAPAEAARQLIGRLAGEL